MTTLLIYLKRFYRLLTSKEILRLFSITLLIIVIGTTGIFVFERGSNESIKDISDALWWTIVTITTVGYGDIYPSTLSGRIIAIFMMIIGIGVLGMFTATIATFLVNEKIKEERGLKEFDGTKHTIICGWNDRAREIIKEIRSNNATKESPVVLLASIDSKPLDDENLFFVKGEITEDSLRQANLAQASNIIILLNDALEFSSQDARAVLTTLTVESINPDVYTCVEINDIENERHCKLAKADEIIVRGNFSTKLLARSAVYHGVSKIIAELLSSQHGTTELLKVRAGKSQIGKTFIDVFTDVRKQHNATILAIQSENGSDFESNPSSDYTIGEGDYFIVVAKKMPVFN